MTDANMSTGVKDFLTVGEAARELGVRPREITAAFYDGLLRDDIAPLVGNRRLIPRHYLPVVRMVIDRRRRNRRG